ncbi:DJ-1/PfpI family protein [Massilia glaciei]|uniref:Protease n=1 Tax=Massilia glaciei TaxID=1524097 RepID=A0A2U2HEB2_9BURK|nr:DJ-1/PfpI family protein [Massilia glaciei]PWF41879.1 protease [Massilia glaciei]
MEQEDMQALKGKHVAVLATDGVEAFEYLGPRDFLEQHGVRVTLISPKPKGEAIQSFDRGTQGARFLVEMDVRDARPVHFDGLLLASGEANPDRLKQSPEALAFIREFSLQDKPIAALGQGPRTLIDAGIAKAKHVTSWPGLQEELRKAGAEWTDDEVVVDGKLVTSRDPDDLPAFNRTLLQELTLPMGTDPGVTS